MGVLTQEQKDAFWRDGCLVVPNAVSPDLLARLRAEIAGWVEQSRAHRAREAGAECPAPFAGRRGGGLNA